MFVNLKAKLGWVIYSTVFLLLGLIPFVFELSNPTDAIKITDGQFTPQGEDTTHVFLPHRWNDSQAQSGTGVYNVVFDLAEVPPAPLYLFIPGLKRQLEVRIGPDFIFDSSARFTWSGPILQVTGLTFLPPAYLVAGRNHLQLTVRGEPILPGYLSELYIGSKESVSPFFKRRVLINERLTAMSYSSQIILGIGVFAAFLYRRQEKAFGWLALLLGLSSLFGASLFVDAFPVIMDFFPYVFLLGTTIGCSAIMFALCLIERPVPRLLVWLTALTPIVFLIAIFEGWSNVQELGAYISMPSLILCFLVTLAIVGWGTFHNKNNEAGLVLAPWAVICVFIIHDLGVTVGYRR